VGRSWPAAASVPHNPLPTTHYLYPRLGLPCYNILRQRLQRARRETGPLQVFDCPVRQASRLFPGPFYTQQTDIGRLGKRRVAAGGLAELGTRGRGVEHVVGNLEGESDVLPVGAECVDGGRRGLGRQRAPDARGTNQRARLALVDRGH